MAILLIKLPKDAINAQLDVKPVLTATSVLLVKQLKDLCRTEINVFVTQVSIFTEMFVQVVLLVSTEMKHCNNASNVHQDVKSVLIQTSAPEPQTAIAQHFIMMPLPKLANVLITT